MLTRSTSPAVKLLRVRSRCTRGLLAWTLSKHPRMLVSESVKVSTCAVVLLKQHDLTIILDAVTQYIVLEIHYNNPEMTAGIVDSSGVRMTMTADLRPIDAGIFTLGVNTGDINIPANSDVYEVRFFCSFMAVTD